MPFEAHENLAPDTPWSFFCSAFDVPMEDLDMSDLRVRMLYKRVVNDFFSSESSWSADFESGNINLATFKLAFWSRIEKVGMRDVFMNFLNFYMDNGDKELAFDVDENSQVVNLAGRIRDKVLLRRELMPMEIHEYKDLPEIWLAWVTIAEKLMEREKNLTQAEQRMFAAGLTHYKDFLLTVDDLEVDYYTSGKKGLPKPGRRVKLDLEYAIQCFYEDYDHNSEIDREIKEVEFFLDRLRLPDKFISEAVDIACKTEEFYRARFRKSDTNKYDAEKEAAEFSHPLQVLKLCLGTVEATRHSKDMIPPSGRKFWTYFDDPLHVLNLSIDASGHDVPEDYKKLGIPDLLETLQGYLVRAAERIFEFEKRANWVGQRYDALQMLNAKKPRDLEPEQTAYGACILEILNEGGPARQLVKLADDLHNGMSRIPASYIDDSDEASPKFIQKLKDKESLLSKGLEIGFYWFVPLQMLDRVFEANGKALLAHSFAWREIYTNIYLPRKGGSNGPKEN